MNPEEQEEKNRSQITFWLIGVAVVAMFFYWYYVVRKTQSPAPKTSVVIDSVATSPFQDYKDVPSASKPDVSPAIKMMVSVFEGGYSYEFIEKKMNKVMRLYDMEITEQNYMAAGSALVSLKESTNNVVSEMAIIDYMLKNHVKNMKFADMAATTCVILEEK